MDLSCSLSKKKIFKYFGLEKDKKERIEVDTLSLSFFLTLFLFLFLFFFFFLFIRTEANAEECSTIVSPLIDCDWWQYPCSFRPILPRCWWRCRPIVEKRQSFHLGSRKLYRFPYAASRWTRYHQSIQKKSILPRLSICSFKRPTIQTTRLLLLLCSS